MWPQATNSVVFVLLLVVVNCGLAQESLGSWDSPAQHRQMPVLFSLEFPVAFSLDTTEHPRLYRFDASVLTCSDDSKATAMVRNYDEKVASRPFSDVYDVDDDPVISLRLLSQLLTTLLLMLPMGICPDLEKPDDEWTNI